MSQRPRDSDAPVADENSEPSATLDAWIEQIGRHLNANQCDALEELGIYSVHDRSSCKMLTIPADADRFDDVSRVKQFYADTGEYPLLIVVPVTA